MFIHRGLVAGGLALLLTSALVAAPTRSLSSRNHRSRSGIEGTVVRVHHDRSHRNAGWIKVRRGTYSRYGHRRGTSALAAASRRRRSGNGGQVMTFAVNSSTRFQRLGNSNRSRGGRASFGSVRSGERVRVLLGSGQQHAARLVDILANSYNHSRHRSTYATRSGVNHRSAYRHSLIRSQVLTRQSQRPYVRVNRPVVRNVVNRPVRHTLIQGSRQTRNTVAARVVKNETKQAIKHEVKNHKPAMPKHTTPTKHTTPPKHSTPPKHTTTPKHTPTHTNHPHPPAHHKR